MATDTKNTSDQQLVVESQKRLQTVAKRAYSSQTKQPIENEQIAEFLPLVHKIAQRVGTYLKPPLSYEDLVSAGTVGLVKAARNYDPSHQAEFQTYAYIRIKGAILDELREWSFMPANVDKQIRTTLQMSLEITEQTGSAPNDADLAEKLDIPIDKLYEIFEKARAKNFISIDSSRDDSPGLGSALPALNTITPDKQLERSELVDKLTKAIQQLNEKQRQIILLYYQQQLTMKQIAEVFKITESRVSQLHSSALFNLSVKLRNWKNGK